MSIFHSIKRKSINQDGVESIPKRRLSYQLSTDPFLDWVIVLIVGMIFTLALVGVGISVYLGTEKGLSTETAIPSDVTLPFDGVLLDRTLRELDQISVERKSITEHYKVSRDPSLP